MDSFTQLIGPPQINLPTITAQSDDDLDLPSGDPFMDLMMANFNTLASAKLPLMGFTENFSPTFLSTGNPCLDFFFHVVPDTTSENLASRLDLSWKHDPLTTLKLVCNLRGVRGTGKSDKEGFYTAALWLHKNHPKTLAANVKWLAEFGYFKDLPEILFRLLNGPDVRKVMKEEHEKTGKVKWMTNKRGKRYCVPVEGRRGRKLKETRKEAILNKLKKLNLGNKKGRSCNEEKIAALAKKALERYNSDPNFRFLHSRISDVFAEALVSDLKFLKSGELCKISFASKWCPSLDSSFDKYTLLCESIARRVFPRQSYLEYEGIEEAHYAYRIRDRLRKEVLVPLHQALELPEVYMSLNKWESLPYNRVASVAMKNYKNLFKKHDESRFAEYLESVKRGETTIAAGALLPHEIIQSLNDIDGKEVAELQWRRMVEDLLKKGKLENCLAVCDVSGSMSGTPMEVCVALGLLISELNEDPWKGKVITFSQNPQLHKIAGIDLHSKTSFVRRMDWGMNTDFQKVFDLILKVAKKGNLQEDKMIKRVFVFSDMEFDQASLNSWETDYQAIQRKFRENGYLSVPEIVFWNLRASKATPVPSAQAGVALVSGFSKNLITLFLDGEEISNPETAMKQAIAGPEYQNLVVVD
ncbi:hypothetical protein GIB67_009477 [Kingdonia uniflora]|uniref:Uncharacterized protein n=1 Tax=Kingdonia uniflora TaxID=39325 RepID=A0A7J7N3W6_9MAGN|nr:hypothetical protein GIB67_009477 [Kingdonia uniflora]